MAKWKTGGFPYRSFEKERNEALDLLDEVNTNAPHARIRALLDRLREEEVHTCACGARVKAPSPGYWVQFCPTCSPALKKTVPPKGYCKECGGVTYGVVEEGENPCHRTLPVEKTVRERVLAAMKRGDYRDSDFYRVAMVLADELDRL